MIYFIKILIGIWKVRLWGWHPGHHFFGTAQAWVLVPTSTSLHGNCLRRNFMVSSSMFLPRTSLAKHIKNYSICMRSCVCKFKNIQQLSVHIYINIVNCSIERDWLCSRPMMCHDIPNFNALGKQRYVISRPTYWGDHEALSSELKKEVSHYLSLFDIQHSQLSSPKIGGKEHVTMLNFQRIWKSLWEFILRNADQLAAFMTFIFAQLISVALKGTWMFNTAHVSLNSSCETIHWMRIVAGSKFPLVY